MKRWIVRGFCIGVLLLCVGGWGMSAGHWWGMTWYPFGRELTCGSNEGAVQMAFSTNRTPEISGWNFFPREEIRFFPEAYNGRLGFGFDRNPGPDGCRY